MKAASIMPGVAAPWKLRAVSMKSSKEVKGIMRVALVVDVCRTMRAGPFSF